LSSCLQKVVKQLAKSCQAVAKKKSFIIMDFNKFLIQLNIKPEMYPKRDKNYLSIASNKQLASFKGKKKLHLDFLIYSFCSQHQNIYRTDVEVYRDLKKCMKPAEDGDFGASFSAEIIFHYATKFHKNIRTYLDIGCGGCQITSKLAKMLQIQGCGSDLKIPFENSWEVERPKDIKFEFISEKNLLGHVGKWDLITAVMVLHHIPEVEKTIEAISDGLRPGGLLIIKEHDCFTSYENMLVDIEHSLFIVKNNGDWEKKIRDQYIKCRNWVEWAFLMQKYKLGLIYHGPWGYIYNSYGNSRKSVLVFKKL
jgi:2-polyprenyl-3-methyl-5-hydroxy-6-metoxy-1,4-benzoquinol methylase